MTCGMVSPAAKRYDEDIDGANDADFIVSVPDPVDRKIDFELQDAPPILPRSPASMCVSELSSRGRR